MILFSTLLIAQTLFGPLKQIPPDLYEGYSMKGKAGITHQFRDDSYVPDEPLFYSTETVDQLIEAALNRGKSYYGKTDLYLYDALEEFLDAIEGKEVGLIGSTTPWYESILLAYGAHPVTIDYNKIVSDDPRLEFLTVEEYENAPRKFDAILSISSFEHDGLGRYGDPIDPDGDLKAMKKTLSMLNEGGLLFLAVPVGKDHVIWNLHRLYGKHRLPLLLDGWTTLKTFGFKPNKDLKLSHRAHHQPIFVLTPETN